MPGNYSEATLFESRQESLNKMETALSLLKVETINFGYRYINDSEVRRSYIRQAEFLSKTLRWEYECGRLTPSEVARDANQIRNAIMEAHRIDSSDVGRAYAERLKGHGKSLWILEQEKADLLFGKEFSSLSQPEKNRVWLEIVDSAGRPRPEVNAMNLRAARVGRALIFASTAVAVYNVATADDPGRQIVKEGVTAGASVLGGMAGGAVAGLACGPASPICVTIGVFVGGAIAAIGVDAGFDWVW
jgi:hypothetical protein